MGEKWPKSGEKNVFGAIFSPFLGSFFPHSKPWAIFHSVPGALTRKKMTPCRVGNIACHRRLDIGVHQLVCPWPSGKVTSAKVAVATGRRVN